MVTMRHNGMPRASSFKTVESIGCTLPNVEVTTHYLNYPCVLVRLSRVRADALRDLIASAHRFVSAKVQRKSVRGSHRGAALQ